MTDAIQTPPPVPLKKEFELKGWHVLAMLIAFFVLVISVDVSFAIRAYSTFPGEVVAKPYEEGIGFNADIHRRAAAKALGWKASLLDSVSGGRVHLTMSVHDRSGKPVTGLAPHGELTRTVTTQGVQSVTFAEVSPGVYQGSTTALSGLCDLNIKAAARTG